jgi:dephospho-CoA kinase
MKKTTVGLVGGVASGKTTVARFLADNGCEWVNADACAHSVLEREDVKQAVRERWDSRHGIKAVAAAANPKDDLAVLQNTMALFDGANRINRRILAQIVFADKEELTYLEDVMRPHVQALIEQRIAEKDPDKHLILDIPLLYEAGWDKRCDVVWFCNANREVRFQRYTERMQGIQPGVIASIKEMDRRDTIHLSPQEKQERAHYVIRTELPKEEVYAFVLKLLKVVSEPTVYEAWPSGLLLAEQAIHDAMDYEKMPEPSYEAQWAHIDSLSLHLKEEMRRRRL